MTNAQAALIAAASIWSGSAKIQTRDVAETAANLKLWLDGQDAAQTQANIAASRSAVPDDDRGLG